MGGGSISTLVEELAVNRRLVLMCGRYEGFDDRVRQILQPEEISIGDFILGGGEVAAMVVIDAVARLVPGVIGDEESNRQDSFSGEARLLEFAQYTRPREYRGLCVPEVLLSGNHEQIARVARPGRALDDPTQTGRFVATEQTRTARQTNHETTGKRRPRSKPVEGDPTTTRKVRYR